ncbi:MAG: c-type cytochrome domain-containing protein, partial [Pirellulaceae bacterium]|nr:c-type cytochrome domain-containing protein [Pirellulaceae bacterium]
MIARVNVACVCLLAALTSQAYADVSFNTDVLPILKEHCIDCHGPDVQESKLRLDSIVGALRGGDSGEPVITPGDSVRSHLIERISQTNTK